MKINRTIRNAIIVGIVLIFTAACTSDYEIHNKNPYEPDLEDMQADDYLLRALVLNMQDVMMPEQENFSQFVDCLMPGGFSGYVADSNLGSSWSGRFATYNPSEVWSAVPFNDFYSNFYPNYFQLLNQSDNELFLSLAELYRIVVMLRVSDTYGPIPYSKVGVGNAIKSPYDSQKTVYLQMFEDLDKIIVVFNKYATQQFNAGADRVYGGRIEAWGKFANSLKLRMAMRVVYADEALAKKKAEEAVNSKLGVMTVVADGAYRKVVGYNPWIRFMVNWSDARVSSDLICYMNGFKDPRRSAYYNKSTFADIAKIAKGEYRGREGYFGLRRGIKQGEYNSWSHGYSTMNIEMSSHIAIFQASEVAFLRAEGALRKWNMGGSEKELYEEGIRLSFAERKAGDVETYITNSTGVVEPYSDPLKGQKEQKYDYSGVVNSKVTVEWKEKDNFESKLEKIITQKWIAIFPNCMEAWSEHRRTGYPKLMPAAANLSGGIVNDTEGARRLPYPGNEYRENKQNVNAAVDELSKESVNKKGDSMATRLWWDCKPAN